MPTLEDEAIRAVTADGYETQPGFCEKFVREIVQRCYGARFDDCFAASAALTGARFKEAGWSVPRSNGSRPGDLLYKTHGSGDYGHVGIRVIGNRVAENSSCHFNSDTEDARGFRSLEAFGHFDLIIRLP